MATRVYRCSPTSFELARTYIEIHMKEHDRSVIKEYLTEDEPFGPIDASEVGDARALQVLFEHHNKIYRALHKRPSIVDFRKCLCCLQLGHMFVSSLEEY